MKCSTCNKRAETNLKHLGNLCKTCFSTIIEKRIRKYTRINKIFKKNDKILVLDELSFYIINKIIKDLPKKVFYYKKYSNIDELDNKIIKDYIKEKKINKIVVPWTLDDEINSFLEKISLNKMIKKNNYIRLFKDVTEEELDLFSKFNKVKCIKNKKNKSIDNFINDVDKKYPGTKFKLLRSSEKISELL